MFRKTTTDPHTSPNFFSELKKELGVHTQSVEERSIALLRSKPIWVYLAMLICITISLAFFFFHPRSPPPADRAVAVKHTIDSSISELGSTITLFQELLSLQAAMETMLEKQTLSSSDSMAMENVLERISLLERTLSKRKAVNP